MFLVLCYHMTITFLDNTWRVFNWPFRWEFTCSRCQPCTDPCWVTGEEFPTAIRFTRFRHGLTIQSGCFVYQGDRELHYRLWCSTGECHYANCRYVCYRTRAHVLFSTMIIPGVMLTVPPPPPILDAIMRPPCEIGQVHGLINELLVHVGLIKVNSLICKTLAINYTVFLWLYNHVIMYNYHSQRTRNSSQWKISQVHFWLWGMWPGKIISLEVQQIYSLPS